MGYRIAVATSDGVNVDLHFGATDSFVIYEVDGLDFEKLEDRDVPKSEDGYSHGCVSDSVFGSESGCSSGCGDRNGCHGGEKSHTVELLSDCRCVVSTKVGRSIVRQFERRAITTFEIMMPINEVLPKIVGYYYRIDNKKISISPRGAFR